jgi:hypothetical protein
MYGQVDRDSDKYVERCERNKRNVEKGLLKRKETEISE